MQDESNLRSVERSELESKKFFLLPQSMPWISQCALPKFFNDFKKLIKAMDDENIGL